MIEISILVQMGSGDTGLLTTNPKGYIYRPKVMNTWGDGIYVGRRWGLINDDTPTDITISEPTVLNAGRNGISLSAGTRVNILMPYVFGVKGKAPEAGIDIEPEAADGLPKSHLKDCIITSPTIENCKLGLVGYFFQMILHMN